MVALALLAGSLLLVARVMTVASRSADVARATTAATMLAGQKLEQLRALAFAFTVDGAPVDDRESDASDWPGAVTGGRGLSLSPPGTLAANTTGFVDYLDGRGQWLGHGSSPPAGTAFVRRWSIEADTASSEPVTLVLRVGVWRRGLPGSWPISDARAWIAVVLLEGAKTRRAM